MILTTCATITAVLAAAAPGATIRLTGDCPAIVINRYNSPSITIDARDSTVHGLTVEKKSGGIIWRGGTIRAPVGIEGIGPPGYGANIAGSDVILDGVLFIQSNRSVVGNYADNLTVRNSRFELGQDGIIIAGGSGLKVSNNLFTVKTMHFKTCEIQANGNAPPNVIENISKSACDAKRGTWADGWHQDAVQLRDGVRNFRVVDNKIVGVQQGIGEMAREIDQRLANGVISGNDIAVSGYHSITFYPASTGIVVTNNKVRQTGGKRTVIRVGGDAIACGNNVQRVNDLGGARCR